MRKEGKTGKRGKWTDLEAVEVHALHDVPSKRIVLLAGSPLPEIALMTSFPKIPPSTEHTGAISAMAVAAKSFKAATVRSSWSASEGALF